MIYEGTQIILEGIPYKIISVAEGGIGKYMLIITHESNTQTEMRDTIVKLINEIGDDSTRFRTAELIIDWFLDEKLRSGVNIQQTIKVKNKPDYAKTQIRSLLKNGETPEQIIEVLAFAITDKFWSGILGISINTIAKKRDDGLTLYDKIKTKMIMFRNKGITEVHQETEDEMLGVIVTE
jgi:alkylhydroperoxidase/carboxymuconolactone decarboxylase family protein YurZ